MPDVLTGSTEALREIWAAYRAELPSVRDDEWARITPCPEWDVHDLVAHVGAVESMFQGFPQPEVESDFPSGKEGIDHWTAIGVAARRDWTHEQVVDEALRAGAAQLARLEGLDEEGWQEKVVGPLGPTTIAGLTEIRTVDLYLHLLDLRAGLGRPLQVHPTTAEPRALEITVERTVSLSGWGLVKKAGARDDARVRLDLAGPSARTLDLVVEGGRGRLEASDHRPGPPPIDRISGTAAAYTLTVSGREGLVVEAGGVTAEGPTATLLLERYRLFT